MVQLGCRILGGIMRGWGRGERGGRRDDPGPNCRANMLALRGLEETSESEIVWSFFELLSHSTVFNASMKDIAAYSNLYVLESMLSR